MRGLFTALVLICAACTAVWADDFHFGEQNGASLGAKIENGRLIYAIKNSTGRSWKYVVHVHAQIPMYDNLNLIVIDESNTVHYFSFVDSRDGSWAEYKTLAADELYQESIDLLEWSRINARNKLFSFKKGKSYRVYLHYSWREEIGTAEINYGAVRLQDV